MPACPTEILASRTSWNKEEIAAQQQAGGLCLIALGIAEREGSGDRTHFFGNMACVSTCSLAQLGE